MKPVILWIKHNPIAVVSVGLCIASIISLMVVRSQSAAFIEEMQKCNAQIKTIQRLKSTRVKIPAPDLDNPVTETNITVNKPAIEALQEVYKAMGAEYTNIFALAVDQNRKRHAPMMDGLFPDPGDAKDKLYDARDAYLAAFREMLDYYTPNAFYPRLNAGPPIDMTKIQQVMQRVEQTYLTRDLEPRSLEDLKPVEHQELLDMQRAAGLAAMRKEASKIHIYASSPESIFQIGEWSNPGTQPNLSQIWKGQMELWVQQDIVQAIGVANRVWDMQANVMTNPIKQLIHIEVIPGYVGINTSGGISDTKVTMSSGRAPSGAVRLPNDFRLSPTGRRSNTIYDVVHARVDLIVDFQRLPEVFEAFGKTNFMNVLSMTMEDVDEYAMLRKGYMLGEGDSVKVSILLETLWLREWTTRLMPEEIRKQLGIEKEKKTK